MKNKIINECISIAREEKNFHPEFKYYLHWTFIIKNKRILCYATNKSAREILPGYHSNAKIHSEIAAIKRARSLVTLKEFSVVNVRLNRKGELRNSAPCRTCYLWLRILGCKQIFYTETRNE